MDVLQGLCNGGSLEVLEIGKGSNFSGAGIIALIPRIKLNPSLPSNGYENKSIKNSRKKHSISIND
jgi:hypothetical protein